MKTLYKFVSGRQAVLAIAGGSLKFTNIADLNDPSELVPAMNHDAVRDSLAVIRKDGYAAEQFEWLGRQEAILRLLSPETRVLARPASIELANRTLRLPIFDDLAFKCSMSYRLAGHRNRCRVVPDCQRRGLQSLIRRRAIRAPRCRRSNATGHMSRSAASESISR
jgi:hypothetical protein